MNQYNPYNQLPIYNVMPSSAQKYYPQAPYQSYQPYQPQPVQAANQFPMSIAYVTGLEGANAFTMVPGTSMFLIDNENQLLFLKECDQQGKSSVASFRLSKIDKEELKPANKNDFITRAEFDEYVKKTQVVAPAVVPTAPAAPTPVAPTVAPAVTVTPVAPAAVLSPAVPTSPIE